MRTNKAIMAGAALAGMITGGLATATPTSSRVDAGATAIKASAFSRGVQAEEKEKEKQDCKGKDGCGSKKKEK